MQSVLTMKAATPVSVPALRWTRYSLTAVFFVNGIAMGAWSSAVPGIAARLGLDPESYGFVLGPYAIGAILSMLLTGWLTTRFGSRRIVPIGGALVALTLLVPGHAPTLLLLAGSVFILGVSNSVMDIAMNSHATLVERDWGAEIMSTFHSSYSFGALAGAALAGVLFDHGFGPNDCLFAAMLLILLVVLLAFPKIEDLRPDPAPSQVRVRLWTNGKLLLVAALATVAIYCEFGLVEWSYKYLRDVTHASDALATLGNGGFALGMAFSRLVGDSVIRRIGPVRTVAAGAALSFSGLLVAIFSNAPLVAMSGFIMAGLGLANMVPMLYTRAAAIVPATPGRGVSVCGVIGYFGALIEPLTIGYVAAHFNQRIGLCLPLVGFVVIGLASVTVGQIKPTTHH